MRIAAFMNQKGGVGKTTTAASIGSLLANEHGKRVLMIDLDPQGNLSDHMNIDPATTEKSIYNVMIDGMDPREALLSAHNMDVLPANIDLSAAEIELAGMMMRETRLKNAILPLCKEKDYDFVMIDCPPSLGILTISALTLATEVVVPMEAEYLALRGLSQLVHTMDLVQQHLNPGLHVSGVVFCMYDGRTILAQSVRAEVERFFPGKVYASTIRKNVRLAESPSHGMTINLYDPQCAGTQDYRAATLEFLHGPAGNCPSSAESADTENAEEKKICAAPKQPTALPPEQHGHHDVEDVQAEPVEALLQSVNKDKSHKVDPSTRGPIWKADAPERTTKTAPNSEPDPSGSSVETTSSES